MEAPKNLLLRMPDAIDRAVKASSLIVDLKTHLPKTKLTLMCKEGIAELFLRDPHVDEIFSFSPLSGWVHRMEDRNILHPIRHSQYDCAILTDESFPSAWWFWRSRIENRIGFAFPFSRFFLTQPLPVPSDQESFPLLLKPLGIGPTPTPPKLWVSREEKGEAERILHLCGAPRGSNIIALHPGNHFDVALAQKLVANPGVFLVLLGDSSAVPSVDLPPSIVNLAGKTTLRESMAIIQSAALFISKDEETSSIAAALDISFLPLSSTQKEGAIYQEIMRLLEEKAL